MQLLRARVARTAASRRASSTRCRRARAPEFPVSRRGRRPQDAGARRDRTRSTASSWRRACRSSCGARCRTTSCSKSRPPDELREPTCSSAQVKRMLADPRSRDAGVELRLPVAELGKLDSDRSRSGRCSPTCRPDIARATSSREATLFIDSIFREDRSVLDLLDANHTYLERAPRAPLRHQGRARRAVPARRARGREALGLARQGRAC